VPVGGEAVARRDCENVADCYSVDLPQHGPSDLVLL